MLSRSGGVTHALHRNLAGFLSCRVDADANQMTTHSQKKLRTLNLQVGTLSLSLSSLDICKYFRLFPAKTCSLHAWTFACSLVFPIGTREDQTTSMIRLVSIVCSFRPRSQLSLFFKPVQLSTPTLALFDGHLISLVAEMKRLYCSDHSDC